MIIILLLFLPFASTLLRAPQPVLQNVIYSGSGCPVDTLTQAELLPLNTTTNEHPLIHSLTSLTPSYGPGIPITEMRKNCVVTLNITVSPEWFIRVHQKGTWVEGFARLADNSTTLLWRGAHIYYEGMHRSSGSVEIQGPFDGSFRRFVPTSEFEYPWIDSPCGGGALTIIHQLRVVSGTAKEAVWIGELEGNMAWTFTTDVQVLKCVNK